MAGTNGHSPLQAAVADRSVPELFQELAQQTSTLVSLELALARTEMSQKVSQVGKGAGYMAAGGFVIYAGFLGILAAIVIGLSNLVPLWLSALIVGLVVAVIGYLVVQKGISTVKSQSMAPTQTLETLKDSRQIVQGQAK